MSIVPASGGESVGEIASVVENSSDRKQFIVVERGGVFGFFAKEIAVPVDNLAVRNDELVLRNMDVAQLDAMPEFEIGEAFRELDDNAQVSLPIQP